MRDMRRAFAGREEGVGGRGVVKLPGTKMISSYGPLRRVVRMSWVYVYIFADTIAYEYEYDMGFGDERRNQTYQQASHCTSPQSPRPTHP